MTQNTSVRPNIYADTQAQAVFHAQGPQPQFLWDDTNFKVILGALEPGQEIPVHPESLAMYHFLSGTGTMTIDNEQVPIQAGTTVITPDGARRGMLAATRVVFLAAKPA